MLYPPQTILLQDGRVCTLRSARAEDAQCVIDYMHIMLDETPYLLRSSADFTLTPAQEAAFFERQNKDPRAIFLLGEIDGAVAGVCNLNPHSDKPRTRHRADLGISVRRDYWRLGLGSAMMGAMIAFARKSGFEQIELEVVAANRRALRLYVKFGFEVYGTRPHGLRYADGSYADDYLMMKRL